jgi:hypothetical protein
VIHRSTSTLSGVLALHPICSPDDPCRTPALREALLETCRDFGVVRKDFTFLQLQAASWRKVCCGHAPDADGGVTRVDSAPDKARDQC